MAMRCHSSKPCTPKNVNSAPAGQISEKSTFTVICDRVPQRPTAMTEVIDSEFEFSVASAPASYLNAVPDPIGDEFEFSVASAPASYLNAVPDPIGDEFEFSVASAPASYLNAVPESNLPVGEPQFWVASGLVYYLNDN